MKIFKLYYQKNFLKTSGFFDHENHIMLFKVSF